MNQTARKLENDCDYEVKLRLLIADDEIDDSLQKAIVKLNSLGYEVKTYNKFNINILSRTIESFKPHIVFLDIKWDEHENLKFGGIQIFKTLSEKYKGLVFVAFSNYSEVIAYRNEITSVNFDQIIFKGHFYDLDSEGIRKCLNSLFFLARLRRNEIENPMNIELKQFKKLEIEIRRELSLYIYDKYPELIEKNLEKYNWIILCNNKIIMKGVNRLSAKELYELYKERQQLEKKLGFPTFYYSRLTQIEELSYNFRRTHDNDYYPTIDLHIEVELIETVNGKEVLRKKKFPLTGDFDTGCERTHVDGRKFENDSIHDIRSRYFNNKPYKYFELPVKIMLKEPGLCKQLIFNVVTDWTQSGFVSEPNALRIMLTGRDIILNFTEFKFILSGKVKKVDIISDDL